MLSVDWGKLVIYTTAYIYLLNNFARSPHYIDLAQCITSIYYWTTIFIKCTQ